jgi:hypothetical protein
MAVTVKNADFWDVVLLALIRTDVLEERSTSVKVHMHSTQYFFVACVGC